MRLPLLIILLLMPPNSQSTTPKSLTDAIAQVESSFGKHMRSHDGQSLGFHQMRKAAWQDVNTARTRAGLATHPFYDAMDYKVSTEYCNAYLSLLSSHLQKEFGRGPTRREVLAAYRAGFTGFKRLDFNVAPYNSYILAVEKYL